MDAPETLRQLLVTYGCTLCDDPRRVEALLRDLCGEHRKEIFVLVSALRERVPADLLGWPAGVPQAMLLGRLALRLEDDLGFSPDTARWAVETWAGVLRDLPARGTGAPPQSSAHGPAGGKSRGGVGRRADWSAGSTPRPSSPAPEYVPLTLALAPQAVVHVSPQAGTADYTSIGDAIRGAEAGTRVVVHPGVYAEEVVLDRPVEVVAAPPDEGASRAAPDVGLGAAEGSGGAGGAGRVVVEATETSCLRMATGYAVVRGLVLRGRTGLENRTLFAVDVPQGRLVLEDCEVTSDALACVAIRGRTADPMLRRCQIHAGKGSGVFVHHGGTGTLEDCAIVANAMAGVEIGHDGNPTLRRCIIMDGRGPGVYVSLGGAGTFESCVVSGNAGAGVEIGWHGGPLLRRCRVTRNGQSAVRLYAGGGGTFEACDLRGNAGGAWDLADGWLQHNGARSGSPRLTSHVPGPASQVGGEEDDEA